MGESAINPQAPAAAIPTPARRRADENISPGNAMSVYAYFKMHFIATTIPLAAGFCFFGFRATATILFVLASTMLGVLIWRRIGKRGRQLQIGHALWMSLLLGMMMPAHLATFHAPNTQVWPILPAAGFLVAILLWLLGGIGSGRVHAVLVAYLLLTVCFSKVMEPGSVLERNRLIVGDVLDYDASISIAHNESWLEKQESLSHAAARSEPPAAALSGYTQGQPVPDRAILTMQSMIRDQIPPLEDVILGAVPGAIGAGCSIAVFIGGLFLVYRGLIDFRIPMWIIISMFVSLLILPAPVWIREHPLYAWCIWRNSQIGWPIAITFAAYEIFSGTILFTAFFLATSPTIRPMMRGPRIAYAIAIGILSAHFQLYVSVSIGPYVALLLVSLMTPTFDRWIRPKPLV